jgi:hypothetical protein
MGKEGGATLSKGTGQHVLECFALDMKHATKLQSVLRQGNKEHVLTIGARLCIGCAPSTCGRLSLASWLLPILIVVFLLTRSLILLTDHVTGQIAEDLGLHCYIYTSCCNEVCTN